MNDGTHLLPRFNQLIRDVESGAMSRNTFRQWEVELLIDMQGCQLGSDRRRVLRRYQKAVQRSLEQGAARPLKLSEYLTRTRKVRQQSAA